MDDVQYSQIHVHSKYSVNDLSGEGVIHRYIWPIERIMVKRLMLHPEKISRLSREMGISYVAITDHNTVPPYEDDRIIVSEEWGQRRGHASFIGVNRAVPPDCGYFSGIEPENPMDFYSAVRSAREMNAFVVINHPFKRDAWRWGDESYSLADAIEIWNGKWNSENARALLMMDKILGNGIRILPAAGNDFHTYIFDRLNENLIVTEDARDKYDFIYMMKNGDYSIVRDKGAPYIFINRDLEYRIGKYREGIQLRVITKENVNVLKNPAPRGRVEIQVGNFVRLELWNDSGPLSFSTPSFFKH